MIDLSNVKAAGWQRVVAELSADAPDDWVFLERLLRILAQVSAARQAVLLGPDRTGSTGEQVEPKVELVWPPVDAGKGQAAATHVDRSALPEVEYNTEVRTAARACFESGQARAFSLGKSETYYDGSLGQGYILAIPLAGMTNQGLGASPGAGVPIAGAVTLLIEPRGQDAVRSTLAMAEVLAGYVQAHHARQALKQTQAASLALDLATKLIASINTAKNFRGACIQFVNDIAKQFQADRVALGWVRNDRTRVEAISDIEHFDRRTNMVTKLAAAMDECLDQEQPILFPLPSGEGPAGDIVLSQAIVHAHRELAGANANLRICSLPLRVDEEVVGVLSVETTVGAADKAEINVATVELLQAALDLIAPVMRIRRSDDRILPLRAWDSTLFAGSWLVGPKHTAWKLAGVTLCCLLLFVTFYRTTYRPSAEAMLEPSVRRIVSTPFDGIIKRIGKDNQGHILEPGAVVQAGDLLLELDTTELELSLQDAQSKVIQAEKAAASARAQNQQDKVAEAEEEEKGAEAQAQQLRERISRARIVAPITGTIIAGDLKDRLDSTLRLGDPLFQIADLSNVIVTAKVDERDIAPVKQAFDARTPDHPATGQIATKGKPDDPLNFEVETIVPLSTATSGQNVFEVRGKLLHPPGWLRPGMEGIAKFNTQRMSLLAIGTRRIINQVRLWLWW